MKNPIDDRNVIRRGSLQGFRRAVLLMGRTLQGGAAELSGIRSAFADDLLRPPPEQIQEAKESLPRLLQADPVENFQLHHLRQALLHSALDEAQSAGERSVHPIPGGFTAKGIELKPDGTSLVGTASDGTAWRGRIAKLFEPDSGELREILDATVSEFWGGETWRLRLDSTGLPDTQAREELKQCAEGWTNDPAKIHWCAGAFSVGAAAAAAKALNLTPEQLRTLHRATSFNPDPTLDEVNALAAGMGRAENSPGAASLAVALWRGSGLPGFPGENALGLLREALRERHGLTRGGWKALALAAEAAGPERVGLLSTLPHEWSAHTEIQTPWATDPAGTLVRCLSSLARACAENRTPERAAELLSVLSPFGSEETFEADDFLFSAALPPVGWSAEVQTPSEGTAEAWANLCARHGIPLRPYLDPKTLDEIRNRELEWEWEPRGIEILFKTFHDEAVARREKFPALFASVAEQYLRWNDPGTGEQAAGQYRPVMDMISDSEPGFWQRYQGEDWNGLTRMSDQWHDLVAEKNASSHRWEPCGANLPSLPEGLVPVELLDGGALHEEGRRMSHCVTSYANRCAQGHSRIFSLRDPLSGKSLATVEFVPANRLGDGTWDGARLAQALGFANRPLEGAERAAADALAKELAGARLASAKPPPPNDGGSHERSAP